MTVSAHITEDCFGEGIVLFGGKNIVDIGRCRKKEDHVLAWKTSFVLPLIPNKRNKEEGLAVSFIKHQADMQQQHSVCQYCCLLRDGTEYFSKHKKKASKDL